MEILLCGTSGDGYGERLGSFRGGRSRGLGSMEKINALQVLSALSVETRFDAVKLLSVVGSDGLPAGELARRLGVRQNTLSDHLAVLTRSGILSSERQSRSIIYRFNPMVLQSLNAFLTRALAQNR